MKAEYILILIAGLLISAYVLEAVVDPLSLDLATPYHYIDPLTLRTYPFTTTIIAIRALAIFLTPVWLLSFIERKYGLKGSIILVLSALSQLYVLQELATGQKLLPLEWSLAISLAGVALLMPMILYFIKGLLSGAHDKLIDKTESDYSSSAEEVDSSDDSSD